MSDATTLYPYVLEPKLSPAIWGGGELVAEYGKRGDPNAKIGESWECWDADTVTNGSLSGASVADLRAKLGARLLGDLDPKRIFPVLTKIITAHDWLSVQVHPDDAYAQRVEHQANGKTESWYVFSAQPGARLVLGWTRDTSREEYERRVADGTLGEILRKIPVKAGDTIYIPAGTVHAIGSGVTLFETQQASDLTYRMFDWNRVGADGEPRQLHIEESLKCINFDDFEPTLDKSDSETLVTCDWFHVERWFLNQSRQANLEAKFAVFQVVAGTVSLGTRFFRPGDLFLVPAGSHQAEITPQAGAATVLRTTI